jgi:hypothetical protein
MKPKMTREPHTVDLDEMLAWIDREHVTFASSSREAKYLEVKLSGGFRVTVRGDVVYEGTDGRTAVKIYNDA